MDFLFILSGMTKAILHVCNRKRKALIIFILLCVFCLYFILNRVCFDKTKRSVDGQDQETPKNQCRQLLSCLTNGSWSLKETVTEEEVQKRIKMDEFLYDYQGFPKTFVRQDGRCGKNFKVTANGKGSAVCDPYSTRPCCNEITGHCGNTTEHCNCNNCRDFRNYLPAEIAKWNTRNHECKLKEYDHAQTCGFFEKHVSEMVFIGDSLTRHFFVALALLLTNDTAMGGLNVNIDQKRREQCQGELQFIDRGRYNCHGIIAHRWQDLSQVCNGNSNFNVSLEEAYHYHLFANAKKTVKRLLNRTGSIVVLNVGLHMSLKTQEVIEKYVGPLVNLVVNNSNGWPKLIWHNLHAIENFLRSDVTKLFNEWKKYNEEMASYLTRHGIAILDSSQLTRGIKSYDARHFGLGGNMMKVQVLLNYLEKWFGMCKNYETRE